MKKTAFLLMALIALLLLAACTPTVQNYQVIFMVDGEVYATVTINDTQTVILPQAPEKEGYVFEGWYWDQDGERPFYENSLNDIHLSGNLTVYAAWSETEKVLIDSSVLTMKESKISGTVSNTVETFDFLNHIVVADGFAVVLTSDAEGLNEIEDSKIVLQEGENLFYVHLMAQNETAFVYEVRLYRKHLFAVQFDSAGGCAVQTQYVEEGAFASEPTSTRLGYDFVAWDFDFSMPVYSALTVTASWEAKKDTKFFVEYYMQNEDLSGYDYLETKTHQGETDAVITITLTPIEHYMLNSQMSVLSGKIEADGSLTLKVYYTRIRYNIQVTLNDALAGTVTGAGEFTYGTQVTLTATPSAGYVFGGWYEGELLVCEDSVFTFEAVKDVTYTAHWETDPCASYKVQYYFENVDKTDYVQHSSKTETYMGIVGDTVYAQAKTFAHFALNASMSLQSGIVESGGTLVLKLYYTRNEYIVDCEGEGGSIVGEGVYAYDTQVSLTASVNRLGYVFVGWFEGDTLLSTELEYETNIAQNVTAKFDVAPKMKGFDFTSTDTICIIHSVKNHLVTSIFVPDYVTEIAEGAFAGCSYLESLSVPFVGGAANATETSKSTVLGYIFGATPYSGGASTRQQYGTNASQDYAFYYIPQTLANVTVRSGKIHYAAFHLCVNIKNLTIGENVQSIGKNAFYECTGLETLYFNVKELPDLEANNMSFANAGKSSDGISVVFGQNVTKVPANLFCVYSTSASLYPNVKTFTFEEGSVCTAIGTNAFRYNKNLKTITIPSTVTSIGQWAFYECVAVEEINLFATSLSDFQNNNGIFYNCGTNGEGIALFVSKNVPAISAYLFCPTSSSSGYAPKIKTVTFEQGSVLSYIGDYAFCYNAALEAISIPSGVISVGYRAFYSCRALTDLTLPHGLVTIGNEAFSNCSFKTLTIPANVKDIGKGAFKNCTALETIYYKAVSLQDKVHGDAVFASAGTKASGITIYIDKDVQKIPAHLFNPAGTAPKITSVTFAQDSACTSIGEGAFRYCEYITSINLPDSLISIGALAFRQCSGLESITIPASVITIGDYAFADCIRVHTLYLDAIALQDFAGSNSTFFALGRDIGGVDLIVGKDVTKIPAYFCGSGTPAFFQRITFAQGSVCTSIGTNAFSNCSTLLSVTLGESVSSIGSSAFRGCQRLVEIINKSNLALSLGATLEHGGITGYAKEIHAGESKIVNVDGFLFYTFDGVHYLMGYKGISGEVRLPESYNEEKYEIYKYAFDFSTSITKLTITAGVRSIGFNAFQYSSISEIIFEVTEGWTVAKYPQEIEIVALSSADLSDNTIAKNYLKSTYLAYVWRCQ